MTDEKFLMISMEDPKAKKLADVLGNKSCKKIVDYLADNKEASAKDLSDALKMPMNTVDYNIKKLVDSGIVEKKKNFFWSKKGKKIVMYGLSNKSIVISLRNSFGSKFKTLVPAFIIAGFGTILVRLFNRPRIIEKNLIEETPKVFAARGADFLESAGSNFQETSSIFLTQPNPAWIWFLVGTLTVILIFAIINWRKL